MKCVFNQYFLSGITSLKRGYLQHFFCRSTECTLIAVCYLCEIPPNPQNMTAKESNSWREKMYIKSLKKTRYDLSADTHGGFDQH